MLEFPAFALTLSLVRSCQSKKVSTVTERAHAKQHILDWILLCILFFIDLILISFSRTNVCVTWCVFNIPLVWFHLNSWDWSYSVMQSHGMLVFTSMLAFLSREIINKCVKYGANFEVRRVQADSSTQNAEHQ